MLSKLVFLAPLLAGHGLAAQYGSHLVGMDIFKRQNEAFVPGTTPGCPDDWPMCGTSGICYDPRRGQTCCPGGKYACPSNSFCLQEPYCCPDGLDPETCAQRYGITLSPSSTEDPAPEPTEPAEPTETVEPTVEPTVSEPTDPEPTETAPKPTETLPEPSETAPHPTTTSNPVIPKPPTSTVPSVPSSTAHPDPSLPTASPSNPIFTGGANARDLVGGAAIVFGGLGLLRNLV